MRSCLPALLVSIIASLIVTFIIFVIVHSVVGNSDSIAQKWEQWKQEREELIERKRQERIDQERQDSIRKHLAQQPQQSEPQAESPTESVSTEKTEVPKPSDLVDENPGEPLIAVDLNMSVLWATTNLGATADNLEGNYYGRDGRPYTGVDNVNRDLAELDNISGTKHDPATRLWGNGWRMPTTKELNTLKEQCKWTWTDKYAVPGFIVSYGNNSIFLPAAGSLLNKRKIDHGTCGYYWAGNTGQQNYLYFQYNLISIGSYSHLYGFPIRPVKDRK